MQNDDYERLVPECYKQPTQKVRKVKTRPKSFGERNRDKIISICVSLGATLAIIFLVIVAYFVFCVI